MIGKAAQKPYTLCQIQPLPGRYQSDMIEQAQVFDTVVAGGGPTGLVAAILLAQDGVRTALVTDTSVEPDARTVALMQPAMRLLEHIGLWPERFAGLAQPLRKLVLVDDTGDFFSASRIVFSADELALDAFGWNIPLESLCAALTRRCEESGSFLIRGKIIDLLVTEEQVILLLEDRSTLAAKIILAADGRDSAIRRAAGIGSRAWDYDQHAIAASFAHSVSHEDTSTEYLRFGGPLTTIPLKGKRSALVWMERPARTSALMALDELNFARELQAAIHGELGRVGDIGPRSAFPMRGLMASELGSRRVVLIGEAAHLMPPIGAQGLNISLTDAATAAECIANARSLGRDVGGEEVIRSYRDLRAVDISLRQAAVHSLNRSLLADFLPFNLARSAGSELLAQISPLRKFIMQRGLEPVFHLPRAMR
jgi:2-octaprenyl-6-methoxyphenol hydroxylase